MLKSLSLFYFDIELILYNQFFFLVSHKILTLLWTIKKTSETDFLSNIYNFATHSIIL